jgi:hypothetical protein
VAGWHLLLLEVDTSSLRALGVAIEAMIELEDATGKEGDAAAAARAKLVDVDRARLTQGLVVLAHLLGTNLARSADTTIKTVLTGLGEHVALESERRG